MNSSLDRNPSDFNFDRVRWRHDNRWRSTNLLHVKKKQNKIWKQEKTTKWKPYRLTSKSKKIGLGWENNPRRKYQYQALLKPRGRVQIHPEKMYDFRKNSEIMDLTNREHYTFERFRMKTHWGWFSGRSPSSWKLQENCKKVVARFRVLQRSTEKKKNRQNLHGVSRASYQYYRYRT